ncbi:MAG: peptide chain release factor N(5)-glutamine methyltransferase [Chloroflexota bacterium]
MTKLSALRAQIAERLSNTSETADLDAQVLLAHILDKPRTWLAAHPEAHLTQPQLASVEEAVSRLEAGEPLPYVLGRWQFYNLEFEVTPDVLIPRPETELLVERALKWLEARPSRRLIADVGTGSGCIAIAIAHNIPGAKVVATDISAQALEVARRNGSRHNVAGRIEFVQCDLLPGRKSRFDLICANLPYIPTDTLHRLPIYGREPALALDGGADGLDMIRRLLDLVPAQLSPGGMLLMEIEATQGLPVLSLAYDRFANAQINLSKDLAGRDRLLQVELL